MLVYLVTKVMNGFFTICLHSKIHRMIYITFIASILKIKINEQEKTTG